MRFVVTGSGGFLGSNVVRHLLTSTAHDVVAVSSQSSEVITRRLGQEGGHEPPTLDRFRFANNSDLLAGRVLADGDVVLNCAFPWNRGGRALAEGICFHQRLLYRSADAGVPTFVNVSSQSVYPKDRSRPASEETPVECDSPYATAKFALERLTEAVLGEGTYINARVSSLIGVGYDIRLVNRFVQQALRGEPLVVEGGRQELDYMDVRDAASALCLLGQQGPFEDGSVVNVGVGASTTPLQIATEVARLIESDAGLLVQVQLLEGNEGPSINSGLDCTRLTEVYGFEPQFRLVETIRWIVSTEVMRRRVS